MIGKGKDIKKIFSKSAAFNIVKQGEIISNIVEDEKLYKVQTWDIDYSIKIFLSEV